VRTTLTLDEDVAADLRRIQRLTGHSWKQAVNDALRAGLASLEAAPGERRPVARTPSVHLGRPRIGDISDVHGVLSVVEEDDRR